MLGFPLDGISLLWRWTRNKIVMLVGVSGTWPIIVETRDRGEE